MAVKYVGGGKFDVNKEKTDYRTDLKTDHSTNNKHHQF